MKRKILVTYRIPEDSLQPLRDEGYTLCWPEGERMSSDEILSRITDCVGVVSVFGVPFPEEAILKGKKLRIISNYGAGVDNLNLELATKQGIVVTNTPDEVTEPTAEMAAALMLALARRLPEMDHRLRIPGKVKWGVMENLGVTLYGKILGILGFGRIGQATARRANALGMQVIYYSRHRVDKNTEQQYHAGYVSFEKLLESSDILSLHTPLTEDTFHMIDANAFAQMKPEAFLVNTARGAVVDEIALVDALTTGRIAGAALDVFEREPAIPEALLKMENVIVAPHAGTATWETRFAIGRQAAQNILEYFSGQPPKYCVNTAVLT